MTRETLTTMIDLHESAEELFETAWLAGGASDRMKVLIRRARHAIAKLQSEYPELMKEIDP